jgi:RND family efflux transporter MFP subunit
MSSEGMRSFAMERLLTFIGIVAALTMLISLDTHAETMEGIVTPYRVIEVAMPESGVIHTSNLKEGESVKKGDTLVSLDNRLLDASLKVLEARMNSTARLVAASARLALLVKRLVTLQELAARGSAQSDEVDKAQSDVDIAKAEVLAERESQAIAKLKYDELREQIARRTLVSPIDGVVIHVARDRGELVSANQSVVAHIAELDKLHVVSHVAKNLAAELTIGQAVDVLLSDGFKHQGNIEFISPVADPRSGTIQIKVVLDNANGELKSGLRAELSLAESL